MDKTSDYEGFMELYGEEVLRSALAAIDPDKMRMSRDQALTLGGAMQACGCFTQEDFAEVLARSPQDKGTMAKQWGKLRGSGNKGDCTPGTIYKYAQACGWKWPAPSDYIGQNGATGSRKKPPKKPRPVGAVIMQEDATIACLMDEVRYTHKPTSDEASKEIRRREPVPTPPPATYTPAEFAMAVSSGQTFYPCIYCKEEDGLDEKGKKHYSYRPVAQQVFVVDIDNEEHYKDEAGKTHKRCIANPLTIEAALQICKDNGISPFFVYETFSSKLHRDDKEAPYTKFRLCFATEKPLTVQKVGEKGLQDTTQYFISLFGAAADTSTTDPARMIFGTDEPNRAKYSTAVLDNAELAKKVYAPRNEETEDASDEKELTGGVLKGTNFSQYLAAGSYDNDLHYFKAYQGRKMGLHEDIDKYLTLYPGLAILGGASSLGKTTFLANMIDCLLDNGETVLFFSLEQLEVEIATKHFARALYQTQKYAMTNTEIKAGKTSGALEEIKAKFAERSAHYEIVKGSFRTTAAQIVAYVERYMADHGGKTCKPVVVDYLQLIAPPEGFKGGVREYTDENIKALKDLQKRNGLFVVAVSAFNRSTSMEPVSYESFRETSAIEYTCDYVWGLQLSVLDAENSDFYTKLGKNGGTSERPVAEKRKLVNDAQAALPKKVQFVSLKNRNGKQFFKADFDYYPQYDCYNPIQAKPSQAYSGFVPAPDSFDVFRDMKAR